eukprot:6479065-Amphidinium_carterae.1
MAAVWGMGSWWRYQLHVSIPFTHANVASFLGFLLATQPRPIKASPCKAASANSFNKCSRVGKSKDSFPPTSSTQAPTCWFES